MQIASLIAIAASALLAAAAPAPQQPDGSFKLMAHPAGLSEPTADALTALCAAPTSKWEQHVCAARNNVQDGCMPQRRYPLNNVNSTNVKGAVLLFHGFTACPDAMENLSSALQGENYLVYTPLVWGHGLRADSCNLPGAFCITQFGRTDRIDQFPRTKQDYINFVQWSIDMLKQEIALKVPVANRAPDFTVAVAGLSLGGPLSTIATSLGQGFFNKTVLVNPFFSAALQPLDFGILDCKKTSNPSACISAGIDSFDNLNKPAPKGTDSGISNFMNLFKSKVSSIFAWAIDSVLGNVLLNHYNNFLQFATKILVDIEENGFLDNQSFLNATYGWGAGCTANNARPGYCTFQIRNLLALNAAGVYALSRTAKTVNSNIAILTTYRDAYARNGITYAAASSFLAKGNKVSMCMFPAAPNCTTAGLLGDNNCGVPHSSFSHAEQLNNAPYNMFWEADMFANVIGFIKGTRTTVGTGSVLSVGKETCGGVTLNSLSSYPGDVLMDASAVVVDAVSRWSQ